MNTETCINHKASDAGWKVAFCPHCDGKLPEFVKRDSLNGATPDLLEAAKAALKLIDAMMPGVRHIALQDYMALNETPLALKRAIAKAESA